MPRPEPPDSGVGSLESPKHPAKEQEGPPTAPTPRPGPQPLRAMEPFKEGTNMTNEPLMPDTEIPGSQSKLVWFSFTVLHVYIATCDTL